MEKALRGIVFSENECPNLRLAKEVSHALLSVIVPHTNGQVVNVIDTPGLFDFCVSSEFIRNEILKCIDLSKDDGIHAVLLVFSVRARFSEEEAASIRALQTYFGPKLTPYIIVVFTGGDDLQGDGSLEDYLVSGPDPLQNIVQKVCKNRVVVFNNKTKNVIKKALQLQELLTLVELVVKENGGHPYTKDQYAEFRETTMLKRQKEEANASKEQSEQELTSLKDQLQKSFDQQLEGMAHKAESKLKERKEKLKQELAVERAARLKAEKAEKNVVNKAKEDVRKLKQNLEAQKRIVEDARRKPKDAVQIVRDGLAIPHRAVHQFVANHTATPHRVVHQFVPNIVAINLFPIMSPR